MPFVFKPLQRYETKELIKEIRAISIQIACLKYDLQFAMYLDHPCNLLEDFTNALSAYNESTLQIESELQKRS